MESLFAGYDITDKINLLIHATTSNMALKMSSVVKQLLYVSKLFRVTAGCIHSFRIRSKETLRIMYPKYPVLDMIQRIHIRFRIKNPDLNLRKETHPTIERLTLITWSLRSGIFQKFSWHAKQLSRNLAVMASNSSSQSSQGKVGKFLQLPRFLHYNHVPRVCWMKSGT